jgi:hypothetical protein
MKIESPTHYAGTQELIRRYREILVESEKHMSPAAHESLVTQMSRQISEMEIALERYRYEQNLEIMTHSWFTLHLTADGVRTMQCPVSLDVRDEVLITRPIYQEYGIRKPAKQAGFLIPFAAC